MFELGLHFLELCELGLSLLELGLIVLELGKLTFIRLNLVKFSWTWWNWPLFAWTWINCNWTWWTWPFYVWPWFSFTWTWWTWAYLVWTWVNHIRTWESHRCRVWTWVQLLIIIICLCYSTLQSHWMTTAHKRKLPCWQLRITTVDWLLIILDCKSVWWSTSECIADLVADYASLTAHYNICSNFLLSSEHWIISWFNGEHYQRPSTLHLQAFFYVHMSISIVN